MPDAAADQTDSKTTADRPDPDNAVVHDVPPSAKLVARTLHEHGELTQKTLSEETLLSPRTVRNALRTLEEHGLVTSEIFFIDARQRLYSLTVEWPSAGRTGQQ